MQKIKLVTATMLSISLSAVAMYPAKAENNHMESQQMQSQMSGYNTIVGTIKRINDEWVTLEMADGTTKNVIVKREELEYLNLTEGKQVAVTLANNSKIATAIRAAEYITASTNSSSFETSQTEMTTEQTTLELREETTVESEQSATVSETMEQTQTTTVETPYPPARPVRALW